PPRDELVLVAFLDHPPSGCERLSDLHASSFSARVLGGHPPMTPTIGQADRQEKPGSNATSPGVDSGSCRRRCPSPRPTNRLGPTSGRWSRTTLASRSGRCSATWPLS